MSMKERILLLYNLNKIDNELNELISLRGDIPAKIEDLSSEKNQLDERTNELRGELDEINSIENKVQAENDELLKKIEKNDNLLRSGSVKSNKEYNALAKEIEDASTKIKENEKSALEDYTDRKNTIDNELKLIAGQLEEVNVELNQNLKELEDLTTQTGEEEKELQTQKDDLLKKIEPEDIAHYNRIANVKFGEAVAVVRKGSCLGCYSSIPPQKAIEIRTADKIFTCESCGRILIAEELITA